VRRSLVEAEVMLPLAVGFLKQASLWQLALCTFDRDENLNSMETVHVTALKHYKPRMQKRKASNMLTVYFADYAVRSKMS